MEKYFPTAYSRIGVYHEMIAYSDYCVTTAERVDE